MLRHFTYETGYFPLNSVIGYMVTLQDAFPPPPHSEIPLQRSDSSKTESKGIV